MAEAQIRLRFYLDGVFKGFVNRWDCLAEETLRQGMPKTHFTQIPYVLVSIHLGISWLS
jgi:hypothetical protein